MDAKPNDQPSRGMVASAVAYAAATVAMLWGKATHDGHLAAAGRQGIDEIGMALRAFPESIQVQESGTIWNPTQGEIASNRDGGIQHSPSAIAAEGRADAMRGQKEVITGLERPHLTPSEIANDRTPETPERHYSQDQSLGL